MTVPKGFKHSEESINKMRNSQRKRYENPEAHVKLSMVQRKINEDLDYVKRRCKRKFKLCQGCHYKFPVEEINRNIWYCDSCASLETICACGCGETIKVYGWRGIRRSYKPEHVNNGRIQTEEHRRNEGLAELGNTKYKNRSYMNLPQNVKDKIRNSINSFYE